MVNEKKRKGTAQSLGQPLHDGVYIQQDDQYPLLNILYISGFSIGWK